MAIIFDPLNKRIILDSVSVSATELYSKSVDWLATSDNIKYGSVFRQVGMDDLGGGLLVPPYFFLQGAWRVRPMESNHNLTIEGNLFVEGGGVPVVPTLGVFQVNVNYTVPVQAQAISVSGGGATSPTATEIATAVRMEIAAELAKILTIPSDVLNAASTTPIHADIRKVKDQTITGTGTESDPWGA